MTDHILGGRLCSIWTTIADFPIRIRKYVILLCRAQTVVFDQPFNLLCIQTNLTVPFSDITDITLRLYRLFVLQHLDIIQSPTLSSILLDICRSAPLSKSEVVDAKLKSWGKEIGICETRDHTPQFDYTCWFDPSQHGRPILADTPPNPHMAARIHRALCHWRAKLEGSILYPRMSRKAVSQATVREWERLSGVEWVSDDDGTGSEFTQETLERIYHEFGVEVEGPCEIRQKWYQSGITPRTYFASGGTAYTYSKYLQGPASDLTAELSSTHPISRLNPARIRLRTSQQYLRIYDLTGFTSNHWECKRFLDVLSSWCHGTSVKAIDAVGGLVELDLGHLLSDYNQQMNYQPGYSLEKVMDEFADVLEYHNRAGFLGVYGNINFSTFVHGASLLMVVTNTDEANIAGDDGHYAEESGKEYIADRIIDANGYLEPTKQFRSDQEGAVCLKRGIIQEETRLLPKVMLVFPSFSNLGKLFNYFPPQFPRTIESKQDRIKLVGNELFRFLRGVYLSGVTQDIPEILDLIRSIYEAAHLPKQGSLPPWGDMLIPVCPTKLEEVTSAPPLTHLLRSHFSDGVALPRYLQLGEEDESKNPNLECHGSWVGTSTRKLRYLETLEYVAREELLEVLWGEEAYYRIVDVFANVGQKVYNFHVLRPIPEFLCELPD